MVNVFVVVVVVIAADTEVVVVVDILDKTYIFVAIQIW